MELYNVETRQKDVIEDPGALQQALLKGTHAFKAGSLVSVKDPEGGFGTVPAENIYEAIKQGYQVETGMQKAVREYMGKPENKGLLGSLKVGLGQFADEAALGIPELILDKTQDPYEVAKREALKEEHGFANTLGGLTGFGASMFLGAPLWKAGSAAGNAVASRLAKKIAIESGEQVGKKTASRVAKEITARAAGTATEGAIVSTPIAITEASLGDPEQAAQTLLAGAGIGALFGVGQGLGKEFLGLGKTVAKRGADLANMSDQQMRKIARQLASTVTALSEDDILYYMQNIDKVNKAPQFEGLKDLIDEAYLNIADDALFKQNKYKEAADNLKNTYRNTVNEIGSARVEQGLADDLVMALDDQKSVIGQLSEQADEALANANINVKTEDLKNTLQSIRDDVIKVDVDKKYKAAAKQIDGLINDLDTLGPEIDGPRTRDILRAVRSNINYDMRAGEFNEAGNLIRKNFAKAVSDNLKKDAPDYALLMEEAYKRTQALEKMSKSFGDREKAVATLNSMLRQGKDVKKELLDEFSELVRKKPIFKPGDSIPDNVSSLFGGGRPAQKNKASIVYDEIDDGIIDVFHGTFDDFDPADLKPSQGGNYGTGYYLTPDELAANNYGDKVFNYKVDAKTIADVSEDGFDDGVMAALQDAGLDINRINSSSKRSGKFGETLDEIREKFPDQAIGYDANEKLNQILKDGGFTGLKFRQNDADNFLIFDKEALYAKPKVSSFSDRFDDVAKKRALYQEIKKGKDYTKELLPEAAAEVEKLERIASEADKKLKSIRKINPNSSQSAMRNMGFKTPNIETRRAFERLEQETGVNYLEMIRDRNILDSFFKQTTQGSRKTNLGATVAAGLGFGAVPAALGLGPAAMAGGAILGAASDIYGGRWLKAFMDNNKNFAGLLFVEKAMRKTANDIDRIPQILDNLSNRASPLGAKSVSIHALFRLLGKDEKDKDNDAGKALEEFGNKMRTWLADPASYDQMMGKFTNPLAEGGAPNISQGLSIGAIKALEYLERNIPKPPKPSSPFAPQVTWVPSDNEVAKFTQMLQIAENPMNVLDELEAGTITSNHMDALKNMFPYVYQRIQEKVMDAAINDPKPLSYSNRVKLSILSGMPLDESLSDESILSLQQRFMQGEEDEGEQQFSPSKNIDLSKSNLTQMQQALS